MSLVILSILLGTSIGCAPAEKEKHSITFKANWEPSTFPDGLFIQMWINGLEKDRKVVTVAPFSRSYNTYLGATVEIKITPRSENKVEVTCTLSTDGVEFLTSNSHCKETVKHKEKVWKQN